MGIFDRLKKDTSKKMEQIGEINQGRISIFDTSYPIDKNNWFQVYSACLGPSVAVQHACTELVFKGQEWRVDLSKGSISFGTDKYPVQFIGSEADASNSWQWGYKNVNNFNENILKLANEVRNKGLEWGLEPLTVSDFTLNEAFNGHSLSAVACMISDGKYCYYKADTGKGAAFLAFSNVPEVVFEPLSISKFVEITVSCLQEFHVDHRIFIESFLMWNDTSYENNGDNIIANFEQDLCIEFERVEEFWRVVGIRTL